MTYLFWNISHMLKWYICRKAAGINTDFPLKFEERLKWRRIDSVSEYFQTIKYRADAHIIRHPTSRCNCWVSGVIRKVLGWNLRPESRYLNTWFMALPFLPGCKPRSLPFDIVWLLKRRLMNLNTDVLYLEPLRMLV